MGSGARRASASPHKGTRPAATSSESGASAEVRTARATVRGTGAASSGTPMGCSSASIVASGMPQSAGSASMRADTATACAGAIGRRTVNACRAWRATCVCEAGQPCAATVSVTRHCTCRRRPAPKLPLRAAMLAAVSSMRSVLLRSLFLTPMPCTASSASNRSISSAAVCSQSTPKLSTSGPQSGRTCSHSDSMLSRNGAQTLIAACMAATCGRTRTSASARRALAAVPNAIGRVSITLASTDGARRASSFAASGFVAQLGQKRLQIDDEPGGGSSRHNVVDACEQPGHYR